MAVLSIFVDSFPWDQLNEGGFAPVLSNQYPLVPGYGYSINLQAELFTGKKPVDLGYFNEWTFDPEASPFKDAKLWCRLLSLFSFQYHADRVAHRFMGKFVGHVGNIPFNLLPYFSKVEADVFETGFSKQNPFSDGSLHLVSFRDAGDVAHDERDQYVFETGLSDLEKHENIALTFVDLDGITHQYGIGSNEQKKRLNEVGRWVNLLTEKFLDLYPNGLVTLFSDHGMVNVHEAHDMKVEAAIGKPNLKSFMYFLDASFARFWCFDPSMKDRISNYLDGLEYGYILSQGERQEWGLDNPKFGDIIFELLPGHVLAPNFFGRGIPAAMHGYPPNTPGQFGIALSNREMPNVARGEKIIAKAVYEQMSQAF